MRSHTLSETRLVKRYVLKRRLGRGGMGSVWEAEDEKLGRRVAVKLMAHKLVDDEKALTRFEREAIAVARLRSPHIVQVHDYGIDNRRPFIVMELLEGETLSHRLRQGPTIPLHVAGTIAVHLCKALATAHKAGVIHRDLKPGNVFLVDDHGDLIAKVYDFGIAKALQLAEKATKLTGEGVILGTPRYMSPEQLASAPSVDNRADLWALGVILYRVCTGQYPFDGATALDLIGAIINDDTPSVTVAAPTLPPDLDRFFRRALAKDPEGRFTDALVMAQDFTTVVGMSMPRHSMPSRPSGSGSSPPVSDDAAVTAITRSAPANTETQTTIREATTIRVKSPRRRGHRAEMMFAGAGLIFGGAAIGYVLMRQPQPSPETVTPEPATQVHDGTATLEGPVGATAAPLPTTTTSAAAEPTASASAPPSRSAKPANVPARPIPAVPRHVAAQPAPQPPQPPPTPSTKPPPKPGDLFKDPW